VKKPLALRRVLTPLWSAALIALAMLGSDWLSHRQHHRCRSQRLSASRGCKLIGSRRRTRRSRTRCYGCPGRTPKCGDKGFECTKGDTAWMMTATAFVLL